MAPRHVVWPQAWRVIASRFPPIDLFERVSPDPAAWEALVALEQATNPRSRDQIGEIVLVAPEDRVTGPGATYVMASFTHLNPKGSRFSNGSYGVYYAASDLPTAIAETMFHFEKFAQDAKDPPRSEGMRVLVGPVDEAFEDVATAPADERNRILAPDDYSAGQAFGYAQRAAGAQGVTYPSVRRPAGACIGAFRPRAVGLPRQERHLQYHWNGERADRYFDYLLESWTDV